MYIYLGRVFDDLKILDTKDGVVEEMPKGVVFNLISKKKVKVQGIEILGDTKFSLSTDYWECCTSESFCCKYRVYDERRNLVEYVVYELGSGNIIYSGKTDKVAMYEYIQCRIEEYKLKSGRMACVLVFSYYDKHYFREDCGLTLRWLIMLEQSKANTYGQKISTGWTEDCYVRYNENTDEIEIMGV